MSLERALAKKIFSLPQETLDEVKDHPLKVIELIEKYASPQSIFIGREKARIIIEKVRKYSTNGPKHLAELGCYVGYSAILLGAEFAKDRPDVQFYSFEINEEFAEIAKKFIDLAGLSEQVQVIVGRASRTLLEFGSREPFDFILIDHANDLYVPDLRLLESLNLIAPGTIIVGDNIRYPGAPDYHEYVNSSPEQKRIHNYSVVNVAGNQYPGRWNYLYESEQVDVHMKNYNQLDTIEITRCVEYLSG
ncbi:hypothetical protein CAAN1_24S00474 [[Candida] anglica]|uniref:catechol O-methyltransferase n=1 Tax=[Candida] anglica TaxID=148631 RepID=A0ABP0EDP9_9ASCO